MPKLLKRSQCNPLILILLGLPRLSELFSVPNSIDRSCFNLSSKYGSVGFYFEWNGLNTRFLMAVLIFFMLLRKWNLLWICYDCFFILDCIISLVQRHNCYSIRAKAKLHIIYNYAGLFLREFFIFYKVLLSIASNGLSFPRLFIVLQSVYTILWVLGSFLLLLLVKDIPNALIFFIKGVSLANCSILDSLGDEKGLYWSLRMLLWENSWDCFF